jgi:SAM-dependent MidA family methyltransferase
MSLYEWIHEEIKSSPEQAIPFARYMELALYHPVWGYYMTDRQKVGKEGDFYTSTSVHPVFAETLADVVSTMFKAGEIQHPTFVEIGGGTGDLCRHLLDRLRENEPDLYRATKVLMIETSPYHRALQRESLRDHEVEQRWYSSLEEAAAAGPIEGVVLSNEWLDAFPVHIAVKQDAGWRELWVTATEDGFAEQYGDPTPQLSEYLQVHGDRVPKGVRIEVNLGLGQAAQDVARLLTKGFVITIDYGDLQEELYHPSRKKGTLMCYHRHQGHDNPYLYVGEQDITCHVNFTEWRRRGEEVGLKHLTYLRQDQFLMRSGLLQKAVAHADRDPFTSQAMKRNRAIVQLVDPAGLGGRFRVMVQGKQVAEDCSFFPSYEE